MKTIILSAWSDVKRNKFFTILTIIEILVLIIVVGVVMQNVNLTDEMEQSINNGYDDAVLVGIDDFDKVMDDPSFDNYAASTSRYYNDSSIAVINPKMTEIFETNHQGKWFSGEVNDEYKEAIVSKKLKKQYKLNQLYTMMDGNGSKIKVKIIGYLGNADMTIKTTMLQFNYLFSNEESIMICDNITKQEIAINTNFNGSMLITFGIDKSYYIQNFNAKAETLGVLKQKYVDGNAMITYYYSYLVMIIFGLVIVGVLCNSVFKTESSIRRNMVKYISGESPAKIAISECIKAAAIFIIPWLIDLLFVTIATSVAKNSNDNSFPILTWKGFWVSTAMVLGVYVFSIIVGLVRVLMAKPLEELKK